MLIVLWPQSEPVLSAAAAAAAAIVVVVIVTRHTSTSHKAGANKHLAHVIPIFGISWQTLRRYPGRLFCLLVL